MTASSRSAPAETDVRPRTLGAVLRNNFERRPDEIALVDDSTTLTSAELWHRCCKFAGGLRAAGIEPGAVVGLMLENSADYFIAIAGTSMAGATCVPINTAYRGTILEHLLSDSRCIALITERRYLDAIYRASVRLATIIVRSDPTDDDVDGSGTSTGSVPSTFRDICLGPAIDPVPSELWDTFAILYTSGTTGKSKGAAISHAQAYAASYWPRVAGPHDQTDVLLVVCPMFHISGLWMLWAACSIGARAAIVDRFSASRFWDDVARFGATSCQMVGPMWDYVLAQPARADDAEHPLRTLFTLPLPRDPLVGMDRFNIELRTGYGLTEGGSLINWSSVDDIRETWALKGRAAGKLRDGYELRLVDEHDVEVPPGTPGEAIVRAAEPWTMAAGYVNNPEASAVLWRNGWLHTGDILRRDEDGWYYFLDRNKDAIRRRGENISSQEIEAEASAHPEVLECAAVGVGDPAEDQEVKIFVLRTAGSELDERSLLEFMEQQLPHFALPRYVAFVDDFARTPTGKIRKVELSTGAAQSWDREEHGYVVSRLDRPRSRAR